MLGVSDSAVFISQVLHITVQCCHHRFSEGTSADREIQRTLMELLNQMDGFDSLGQVSGGDTCCSVLC